MPAGNERSGDIESSRPILDDTVPAESERPTAPPAPAPAPAAPAAQGPGVPGYEILHELSRGGMGVVYQARQVQLKRLVALKMILAGAHAGEHERRRFRLEAEAVARLQHPSIVQIYEVGETEGKPFFSLEFCAGSSLADKLHGTPLPPWKEADVVETLARAIDAAHQAGIVHRDLKPANVLLTADGQPKITDFGLAKQLDRATGQTASGAILGTPSYMAPEQAAGKTKEVSPAADIYALGAILYELMTGRPPFQATTLLDTVQQVLADGPVPPSRWQPKLPRDLETICLKCLHKEPRRRYATALDLAEDLRRFLAHEPIRARPVGLLARAGRWLQRPERIRDAGLIMILHALVRAVVALFFLASCAVKLYNHTFDPEGGIVVFYVSGLGVINFWAGWRTMGKNLPAIWIGLGIALLYLGTKLPFFRTTWETSSDSQIVDPVKILNPVFFYTLFVVVQVIACVVAMVAFQANRDALQRERVRGPAG
jgi:hypothetical protein